MSHLAIRNFLAGLILLPYFNPSPGWNQNSPERPLDSPKQQGESVADRIINPVSDLRLLSMQSEF